MRQTEQGIITRVSRNLSSLLLPFGVPDILLQWHKLSRAGQWLARQFLFRLNLPQLDRGSYQVGSTRVRAGLYGSEMDSSSR